MRRLVLAILVLLVFAVPSQAAKLAWAPWPSNANTITINVPTTGLDMEGDVTKDYVLVMPSTPVSPKPGAGCIRLDHARMVKIIGGECLIPFQGFPYNSKTRRCFAFNDVRNWLYLEGLWCHGDVLDGVEMYVGGGLAGATVEIQNSRFEGINARDEDLFTDGHPDGIYFSGAGPTPGAKQVRVDRVTISTDYQGFFASPPVSGVGATFPINLQELNIKGTPETGNHLQQLFWRADAKNKTTLSNVYLEPQLLGNGTQESLIKAVKPSDIDPVVANRAFWADATTIDWPDSSNIFGVIKKGPPFGGDYVPLGVAGTSYASPGYVF